MSRRLHQSSRLIEPIESVGLVEQIVKKRQSYGVQSRSMKAFDVNLLIQLARSEARHCSMAALPNRCSTTRHSETWSSHPRQV